MTSMADPAECPQRLTFSRAMRVGRRREFEQAFHLGRRASDQLLTVWAVPNEVGRPRLGLLVGRKHGRAVRRNRIKRLLREAFRLSQHRLPTHLTLFCAPRAGVNMTLDACVESLIRLAARLDRRLRHDRPKGESV